MQIIGHGVGVLNLVESLGSGCIVLVKNLCQSSSVACCLAEVALSLCVVALSDVQSAQSCLHILRVCTLRDCALSILNVTVDERDKAEVGLSLRSIAAQLSCLSGILLCCLLVALGKSQSCEVVVCAVIVRISLYSLLVDLLLLGWSLVESS